jgi:hypothetical protein
MDNYRMFKNVSHRLDKDKMMAYSDFAAIVRLNSRDIPFSQTLFSNSVWAGEHQEEK